MSKKNKRKKPNANADYAVLAAVPYQCCPVCNGRGQTLADGFISAVYQVCNLCRGYMVIPMHVLPQVYEES